MISIKDAIPSAAELRRRAGRVEAPPQIPPRFFDDAARILSGAGYREENAVLYGAIRRYLAGELAGVNRKGLFIKGAPGVGKTFGVSILANLYRWPVYEAKTLEAAFLDSSISPVEWTDIIEGKYGMGSPHVIVIDDLGTESCPLMKFGTSYNLMADVIDHRYRMSFLRQGVKTIVTTNLTDAELTARYGFRIDDRLNEMFEFLTAKGESLR